MAATLGFPFTAAQWKELERQAMIYKYMVASVPVPYELLLPIIQNLPSSPSPLVNQLRYSTKQDLEPGRCKRTDGKKWRCSRDVAPNQKYCERHMHRGRPRSRKHVELSKNPTNPNSATSTSSPSMPAANTTNTTTNKKTRLQNPTQSSTPVGSAILPSAIETQTQTESEIPLFVDTLNHSKALNNRGLDWSMEGGSEQQWRQIMQTSHSIFNNDFGEELAASFTDFGTPAIDKTNGVKDSCLDLSMAMALGNNIENELVGQIQTSLGSVSPGGPLAEVLRPSLLSVSSNPTSPYPTGDSPPATTVSSPSGVLQRTMLSVSDGSVCNSPTLPPSSTPTPTDVVGFQWFT